VEGNSQTARERGGEGAELGRRLGVADLEMLGLALEGAALVADPRVDEGLGRLDEATAAALEGQAAISISSAWACCFMVSACTAVLDFERAFAWCDRIAEFAERYSSRYMLAFCRGEYGGCAAPEGRSA
jgi:LuxR family maltose regulon positive regulatory protein